MRRFMASVGVVAAALVCAMLAGFGLRTVAAQDAANKPAFYSEKVRPLLQTKASTMKGGRDGVVIVPGDPANSLLVKLIRHEGPADDPKPMPAKAPKMSDADIATIEQWVKAGAVMPDDPAAP